MKLSYMQLIRVVQNISHVPTEISYENYHQIKTFLIDTNKRIYTKMVNEKVFICTE